MKALFRTIHLYLSLAAGLIITCSCITGTMLVFETEITSLLHPNWYHVNPTGKKQSLQTLTDTTSKQLQGEKITALTIYPNTNRTVEFTASSGKKKLLTTVFVNPYTGSVVGAYQRKKTFLYSIENLHRYLLLGKGSAGDYMVSFSTLFFLFILITGVVLWWPKNIRTFKQRISLKKAAGIKRIVYDLHLATGFYISVFLLVIVSTGLIMAFKPLDKTLFGLKKQEETAQYSIKNKKNTAVDIDHALIAIAPQIVNATSITVTLTGKTAPNYQVAIVNANRPESAADSYIIDKKNGRLILTQLFINKSFSQHLRAYVKPLHTGTAYGWPTKILSFMICLLSLIFPITGLMMWMNRTRKKPAKGKNNNKLVPAISEAV